MTRLWCTGYCFALKSHMNFLMRHSDRVLRPPSHQFRLYAVVSSSASLAFKHHNPNPGLAWDKGHNRRAKHLRPPGTVRESSPSPILKVFSLLLYRSLLPSDLLVSLSNANLPIFGYMPR
ncbi:hypothetical protein PoB_000938600 [Plakobranchus ocellatus]|uniref:Uncharacterized protein n=1 Tax=Plakobranchus ocellatus TaxID=259542 RepID=A0AAV3Y6K6_9GAST|nr:hypothetical protein PoB_000938600 [Plakobranchus ocellatus]